MLQSLAEKIHIPTSAHTYATMVGINFGDLVIFSMATDSDLSWGGGPLYRNPEKSHAQYSAHWLAHGTLVIPFFLKYGVEEYRQLHMPEVLPKSLTEEERNALKDVDGIAFVHMNLPRILEGLKSKYYQKVIVPDERRFLHEESGSSPVKKDPPAFKPPQMGAREWRNLALKAGAREYCIIEDSESLMEIPQEILNEWNAMN